MSCSVACETNTCVSCGCFFVANPSWGPHQPLHRAKSDFGSWDEPRSAIRPMVAGVAMHGGMDGWTRSRYGMAMWSFGCERNDITKEVSHEYRNIFTLM
jgi:hypothetical protein